MKNTEAKKSETVQTERHLAGETYFSLAGVDACRSP
jgi:hypothetical protein